MLKLKRLTALTVRQPYAYMIVAGLKDVEYRSWETDYRGPLVIHAGKTLDHPAVEQYRVWEKANRGKKMVRLWTGGIVGQVELYDCKWSKRYEKWMWKLRNAHLLTFVPLQGKLRLFKIDPLVLRITK